MILDPQIPQPLDEHYMQLALQQAELAGREEEVPVGAVVVCGDRVIAAAHNQREQLHDPTAHAEMIAITQAAESLGDWRLTNCTMYVTLEPCPMCAGAMLLARVRVLHTPPRDSRVLLPYFPRLSPVTSFIRKSEAPDVADRSVSSSQYDTNCGSDLILIKN